MRSGLWVYGKWIIGSRWTINLLRLQNSEIVDGKLYYVSSCFLDFRSWAKQNIDLSTQVKSCFYRPFVFEVFTDRGIGLGKILIRKGMIPLNKDLRNEYRMVWYKVLLDWGLPIELAVKVIECIIKNGGLHCSSSGSRRSVDA